MKNIFKIFSYLIIIILIISCSNRTDEQKYLIEIEKFSKLNYQYVKLIENSVGVDQFFQIFNEYIESAFIIKDRLDNITKDNQKLKKINENNIPPEMSGILSEFYLSREMFIQTFSIKLQIIMSDPKMMKQMIKSDELQKAIKSLENL